MKHLFSLITLLFIVNISFSQSEILYENPPSTIEPSFKIDYIDIISDAEICKLKMIVENTSKEEYILFDFEKVGFTYTDRGTYYPPKAKKVIIYPGKDKSDVVKISDAFDYRVNEFELDVNGLKIGKVADVVEFSSMEIAIDGSETIEVDNVEFNCSKVTSKKGEVTFQFEVVNSGITHDLIVVDPSTIVVNDGASILDLNTKDDGKALQADDSYKFKLSGTSSATNFNIDLGALIQKVELNSVSISSILIKNAAAPKVEVVKLPKEEKEEPIILVDDSPKMTCPPYKAPKDGSVMVKLHTDENYCFKLDVGGFPVITDYTQNSIIYLDQGQQRLKLYMSDGSILEDKIFITDSYSSIGYNLKMKGNGEFNLKYVLGEQVLNEQGKQEFEDMMAKTDAMRKEGLASLEESTNSTSTSNANNTCYGEYSSGSTFVKIKVTWKGSPVSGYAIRINNGDDILGNNETDYDGLAVIKTSNLTSSSVDVYGCRDSYSWSVKGSWVQLDNSNFDHIRLEEVANFLSEMTGMSAAEIASYYWGLE